MGRTLPHDLPADQNSDATKVQENDQYTLDQIERNPASDFDQDDANTVGLNWAHLGGVVDTGAARIVKDPDVIELTPNQDHFIEVDTLTGDIEVNHVAWQGGRRRKLRYLETDGVTITVNEDWRSAYISLDATLTALAAFSTNGFLVQTATDTFAGRTIVGTSNRITVTNGNGVAGNPTLDIGSDVVTLTGSQTLTNKTLTTPTISDFSNATHNHTDAAGGGTLSASAIASGTLATARGGTGVSNATGNLTFNAAVSITGAFTVGAATTISGGGTLALASFTLTVPATGTAVTLDASQVLTNKTLTTPTIGNFSNATHNHTNAAGGGTLTSSAISDFNTQVRTSRLDQMALPTATVSFNSQLISGLADPVSANDAVTLQFLQATTQGFAPKAPVRVATTANITLSGEQTIDGVLTSSTRVLVKNQSTANQNGIYVSAAGAWTRATDFDTSAEAVPNSYIFVQEGTTNTDTFWYLTTNAPITLGSTSLTFTQFNSLSDLVAGNGLTKTGNQIDIGAGTGITVNADTIQISASYVGQTSIVTLGTVTTGTWNATKVSEGYGGTNQNTYALGDLLYSSATNTLSKLAGNTTTTQKFLAQTGNGSVSAAPSWVSLAASDIVSGTLVVARGGTGVSNTTGSLTFDAAVAITGAFTVGAATSITGGGTLALATFTLTAPASGTVLVSGGVSGGQTLRGDTASGGNLTLNSTNHGTKGKILFGSTAAFDETLGFIGIGTGALSPTSRLHLQGSYSTSLATLVGSNFRIASTTATDTSTATSGTIAVACSASFGTPTLAATNTGVIYTHAATVAITGVPTAGTNVTIGNAVHFLMTGANTRAWLQATGTGDSALTRTMAGIELTAGNMTTTSKYTPAVKFGSTDSDFTTESPKFLAMIIGRCLEAYDGDTKGGMGIDFAVTANVPGANAVPVVAMALTSTELTLSDAVNIAVNATTGTKIGTATTQKIAFHNATPVVQRAGAAQVAVATTGATNAAPYGFATSAQADAIVTLVNELRAALVEKGLIKGAA